ncbi:hypothetical protein [Candidatus Amarobacter glycogenicus]|uniref:hypothetical protein n=1 Tax=Candidatus Amarobacter glycogenicus TaxID=3140699 RepID=UPI0031358EA6|nr:hypothetical protein [Dehalococcoidia bacterium]
MTVDPVTGGIDWGTTGTATVTVTGDGVATTAGTGPDQRVIPGYIDWHLPGHHCLQRR